MNSHCFDNDRLTRWSLLLQSFKYTITYIKGSDNIVSDYMSRINYPEISEQSSNANDNADDNANIMQMMMMVMIIGWSMIVISCVMK